MNKKYELLKDDAVTYFGRTLYRIKATTDFGDVKKGELGGYIEKEENLSHYGNAWVSDDARVSDDVLVTGDVRVSGDAWISGDILVSGNVEISGDALVESQKDYIVFKNSWSSFRWFTYTRSNKMWKVGCFYGSGQELIEKAYQDSEQSGKCYEAYVNLVLELEKLDD